MTPSKDPRLYIIQILESIRKIQQLSNTIAPVFTSPAEQKITQITYAVIRKLANNPVAVPTTAHHSVLGCT